MFALDLSEAPLDVLCAIFTHLPARDAFVARLASRRWSHVSELSFAARCAAKGWRLPRRPRGGEATAKHPHRRLFRGNACRKCVDGPGEFRMTNEATHVREFSLCAACVADPSVVEKLREWRLRVDVHSVAIASAANIGAAASAPIVAAHHKPSLVPVSILMALLGYAMGNYLAPLTGYLAKFAAGQ